MRVFIIPIHSIVDVITNSSSVIYTEARANSIEIMKQLINDVLSAAESPKVADDLFTFSMQVLPSDGLSDWLVYADEDEDQPDEISALIKELDKVDGWKEKHALAESLIEKHEAVLFAYFNSLGSNWEGSPVTLNSLVVKTKDGVDTDFADRIISMFEIEASYDS